MRNRSPKVAGALLLAIALAPLLSISIADQSAGGATAEKTYAAPRTPWGHPDLQGTWNAATLTPLERPDNAAGKLSLTKEEAASIERAERDRVQQRARP